MSRMDLLFLARGTFRALPRATHGSKRPVLIVGMPRSERQLVEQNPRQSSFGFGAGELKTLWRISLTPPAVMPGGWNRISALFRQSLRPPANKMAGKYLKTLDELNVSAKSSPTRCRRNGIYLGVATDAVPDCHVIHAVGDPRDVPFLLHDRRFCKATFQS